MKNITQKKKANQKSHIDQLTKAIQNAGPAKTLELLAEAVKNAENGAVKQWLLKFKVTFSALHNGGVK